MSSSGGLGGKYGFSKGRSARGSLGLEAFKFSCYLFIPISMVAFMIGIPENIRKAIDATKYVYYPPEDPETRRVMDAIRRGDRSELPDREL